MKALTGNRLRDGRVVYLAPDDTWAESLADAALFDDADAEAVLEAGKSRVTEIADAYLIDAAAGAPIGREALRETIRSTGPTVHCGSGGRREASHG